MEDKILLYSQLPREEQRAVEAYVERRPELRPLLEEARAWGALLHEARALLADEPDDEVLAYYAITQHLQRRPLPPELQAVLDRLAARLEADRALKERYEEMVQRLRRLESRSDAVAQFEALTGYPLARSPAPAGAAAGGRSTSISWRQYGVWAVAAVLALGVLYGALALTSTLTRSEIDRLAAFEASELPQRRYRGDALSPGNTPDGFYERALVQLRDARTTTLGLFPRYDAEALAEAELLLRRVTAAEAEGSALHNEALYLLARIYLLQGERSQAEAALGTLIRLDGFRAGEAEALLRALPPR